MDRNITLRRSAQKLVKEGDFQRASEAYEEVVSSGETDPYDFVYAGDLYLKLEMTEEAIAHFTRGVAAYSRLGFNRNAIALCRRILRIDSGRLDIHRELGDLFTTEELTDEALQSYFIYLTQLDATERDSEIFRETLRRVQEIAPRRAAFATQLAEFLETWGHGEEAAEVLSRAADLARSSGDEEKASQLMERAIQLNPQLSRMADFAEGIESRLQEVHQRKLADARPQTARNAPVERALSGQRPAEGFQEIDLSTTPPPTSRAADARPSPPSPEPTPPPGARDQEDPAAAAREAMAAGRWKTARQWIDTWLAAEPTSTDAAEALIRAAEALNDSAARIEGLTLMGDLLIQEQDLSRAVPLFWRVLEIDPQNQTALRRIARFRELGLIAQDADSVASDASEPTAPGEGEKTRSEARVLPLRAETSETETAEIATPVEEVPSAEEMRAVFAELRAGAKPTVERTGSSTHYDQGVTKMELGRLDEALADFATALMEPGLDPSVRMRLHERRAKCFSGLGRHRDAIAELEPAAQASMGGAPSASLRLLLALEHESLGELDAAREILGGVLETDPDFEPAARRLAQLEERAA